MITRKSITSPFHDACGTIKRVEDPCFDGAWVVSERSHRILSVHMEPLKRREANNSRHKIDFRKANNYVMFRMKLKYEPGSKQTKKK